MVRRMWDILLGLFDNHTHDTKEHDVKEVDVKKGRLSKKTILVDAGHGLYRKRINGSGPLVYQREEIDGIREDIMTMEIADYMKQMLEAEGATVLVTRKPGTNAGALLSMAKEHIVPSMFPPIGDNNYTKDVNCRWQYANVMHKEHTIDLFFSIHFNASEQHNAYGTETFYFKGNEYTKTIADKVTSAVCAANPGLRNRGAKPSGPGCPGNYAVLRKTSMPAVLWEGPFYDHEGDRKTFLKDPAFYERTAKAIVDTITKELGSLA